MKTQDSIGRSKRLMSKLDLFGLAQTRIETAREARSLGVILSS